MCLFSPHSENAEFIYNINPLITVLLCSQSIKEMLRLKINSFSPDNILVE